MENLSKFDEINVLASQANWAWPEALRDIFQPRGINLLVANDANEFVDVLEHKRIHTAIIDMDTESVGLTTVKIIRMAHPILPCVLLTNRAGEELLGKALKLDVFGVIDKPVEMDVLRHLLNRLFKKKYDCNIFAA